eukprot:Seg318.6 transcript_id=Seg318.6/GoldUCD/mRNA.D3Y31 product="Protein NLRC3" protein_id=Seg318.6/GoldUCD/D3Y31
MSDGLKLQYTAELENWTMPILRLSKYKGTFGNTKKRRKTAMIEPLLREIIEKKDEKPRSNRRNLNMSELQGMSLIKIRDVMQKDSKITIVRGTGGIGKTSLVDYITYQWAQNDMFKQEEEMQFSLVFRFQCRSLNRYKGRKLTANDLFMENFNVNISDIGDKAQKILIILDGFDEYFAYSDIFKFSNKEDSITRIVRNLVTQGTVLFPGHYTLVTGRHHAVDLLQTREKDTGKARWVEVLGFSEHAVEKYVDQFSEGNSSLAAYIKSRIASSVTLQSIATTPVFLRTLCSMLYREGDEFIDTSLVRMTDIYSWIVGSFLKFHFASKDQEFGEISLSQLLGREDVRKFLRDISEDAYKLLVANELEFDCKNLSSLDMSDPVIRNLVNGFVIRSEDEIESKCEFWHVTMQEYFAAYHCVTKMECLTLTLQENNWHRAVQFMAGFISTQRRKANSINHLLVGKFLQMEDDRINDFLYYEPFLEASCDGGCKRRFLEIFFESFAIGDIFSAHLGPQHWGLKSVLDTGMLLRWNISSLSDAVLFSHFGKIMIANGVGSKLGDFWLWLINIRLKKNVLIELFEVLPVCHFASMVSIRLEDALDSDTSKRLLAPFEKGIHKLRVLDLKGCYLSSDTGNLVLDVIPYMEKVNIHFQNFTVSNAKRLARASRRSLAKKSSASAFRLKEIEFVYCSFENGTDAYLAKILPYVSNVTIFSSKSLYGLQLNNLGISDVLMNTSIGFERKLNNLDLCNFDHVQSDAVEGLAASIPYLETVRLNCVMMTKTFVTELVESFLDTLKKNGKIKLREFQICCSPWKQDSSCYKSHEAWIAQILPSVDKSMISFATANSYKHFEIGGYEDFIEDGLAKIIPFIPYVDIETIGLSLNDLKALSTSVLRCATNKNKKRYFKLQHFRFTLMYRYSVARKYIYLFKHMVKLQSLTEHLQEELFNVITKPLAELTTNFVSLLKKLRYNYCLLISKESDALLPVIKSHLRGIAKIVNVHMHLAQKLKINSRKSNEAASFVILFMNQRVVNTLRKGKLKRDLEIVEKIAVDIKSGIEQAKNDIFKESNNSVWCLKELERIERKVANCSNLNMQYNETTKAIEKVQEEKVKLSSEIEELRASSRAIKHPALDMLIRSQRLKEDKMIKLHSEAIELLVQQNQSVSRKDKVLEINSKFLSINRHFKMVIGIFPNQSLTQQSFKYWPVKSLQHAARLIPFVKTVDMGVGVSSSLVDWCEVLLENVRKIAMVKKFKDKFALRSLNLFIPGKGIAQDCSKLILKELGEV